MLVNRRQRRQAEPPADFFEAWGVFVLLDEILKVVQNLALTFGQWLHRLAPQKDGETGSDYTQRKSENQPFGRLGWP